MRFVPEGEEPRGLLTSDPALKISNRVKEIVDIVEKELIEDDVSEAMLVFFSRQNPRSERMKLF